MLAYIVRRILLMIPTIFGILLISFVIVQFAPGGPVERIIAQLQGLDTNATTNFTGGADARAGGGAGANSLRAIAARRGSTRSSSPNSTSSSASTSRRRNASGSC